MGFYPDGLLTSYELDMLHKSLISEMRGVE
jgi:hypothetical protein